ncbi:Hypothetical protein PHPALM_15392, partial [Phytophthora palmivora]
LAVLDCHRLGISGKIDEVETKWNEFDRSTVVTLVIRHCPALEVPDTIGDFHITTGIKVYNSTIHEWSESAAITNTNHPQLIWFYLVRVNVTGGILPAGVLSADFPFTLYDLEFTYTNVRELPDDLDSKWLLGTTVYFEYSELTSVPDSLIRLEPYSISLTGSPITELPSEIFEVAGMAYMYMAGISVDALPRDVINLSPDLAYVVFADTNISYLWPWVDTLVQSQIEWSSPLFMGGSPYCADIEKIMNGEADTFSASPSSTYSIMLMDPSEANRDFLSRAINCDAGYALTVYPIDFEDSINAIRAKASTPSLQYVDLSPGNFALWWVILLGIHLITCGYNAIFALFYFELKDTYLYRCLEYSGIGMLAQNHPVIANVNVLMATIHGGCALLMIAGSFWRRTIADDRAETRLVSLKRQTVRVYSKVWGRRGLMGVNGDNFHAILITRELMETVLQTVQAYRMSWYLPRMLLNRFYLSLLVMNCWSSVFIYSLLFKHNEARKRFACLVSDCILDLISCVGVPLIVVLSFVGDYDSQLTGFPLNYWYDDVWSARVLNEFQMVLVVSWSDLLSRTIFSFGLVATTTSLKELLRKVPAKNKRRIATTVHRVFVTNQQKKLKAVVPITSGIELARKPSTPVKVTGDSYTAIGLRFQGGQKLLQLAHIIFGLWGVIVLGLHIQASVQPELPQCVLQVRPWMVSKPACYLAILDCYQLGITGKKDEVHARWNEFDRSTVVTLAIRHCPALEVPDSIGDFHLTTGIKVYNSTINEWGPSAAITNTNHFSMIWLYFVRVHLPNGKLPEGIMSSDFPGNFELTGVPPVILRLDPYSISFTGSPITELSPEVFEVSEMVYLYMGSIAIQELPRNVTNFSPALAYIYLTDTNVSFFWSWIDLLVERNLDSTRAPMLMGGSIYCNELEKINRGEADTFTVSPSSQYSMLMDVFDLNRDVILHTVNCDYENAEPVYPIAFEDSVSALK